MFLLLDISGDLSEHAKRLANNAYHWNIHHIHVYDFPVVISLLSYLLSVVTFLTPPLPYLLRIPSPKVDVVYLLGK